MKKEFGKIKLLVLDIDGVLTDGIKPIDEDGNVLWKNFYDKDFSALNELRKWFDVVFLSGDNRINENMAARKGIPFYWSYEDKKKTLQIILEERSLTKHEVVFVGDDVPDLECLSFIPLSFCPADAIGAARERATFILKINGGHGVIVELKELLLER